MKRVNLSMTKCINPKCGFRVVSETIINKCPVCKSKTIKDKQFHAQGLLDEENPCVILKEKGRKSDSYKPRNFKK